ncbi:MULTISPECIES: hypothetical protein [Agrobacterium]|uniref:hypothetical protein n=1 Tax=Agrobacterium TaxID=357 RepID=UPI0009BA4608|nr:MULTISPECIES: hypothetical protein [Agrobacterium]QCL77432.1 hypothetical protein CFBP5499_28685 [Agrobacterium tumefaciens]CUX72250.1 conserved hypothetical protein [Agrobacterium sp. NCPPB 925]
MRETNDPGTSLVEKMERHLAAQRVTTRVVREWDERRASEEVNAVLYAGAISTASQAEREARLSIVLHEPSDRAEQDRKLEYLAAFILSTRGPLDPMEMEMIERIADRQM